MNKQGVSPFWGWGTTLTKPVEVRTYITYTHSKPKEGDMTDEILNLLRSDDYKDRTRGEYLFVKDKYEKLHRMIVMREAGTLTFKPNCPMEQWKAQAAAMGAYLYQLEIKAEIEGIFLDWPTR